MLILILLFSGAIPKIGPKAPSFEGLEITHTHTHNR